MTAPCGVVIVAVDAVKVADAALGGTVKVPGTANRDGRLLETETATPPTSAALERVTVHVVLALEARLAAAHLRAERVTGATRESVAGLDEPFNVAVTAAVWSESSAPVLAVNVAEVALAATLTEDGTVNWDGALLESVTTVLLVVDFDRVTVQVVLALEARLAAAH